MCRCYHHTLSSFFLQVLAGALTREPVGLGNLAALVHLLHAPGLGPDSEEAGARILLCHPDEPCTRVLRGTDPGLPLVADRSIRSQDSQTTGLDNRR